MMNSQSSSRYSVAHLLVLVAAAAVTAPKLVAAVTCGSGLSACGDACYNPSQYTCIGTTLCAAGFKLCGTACYDPSLYHCSSGTLLQGAESSTSTGAYKPVDTFSGSTFFDNFDFFTAADPTHGTVQYISQSAAQSAGLISAGNPTVIAADSTNVQPNGRPSVRITSKKSYNTGVFVFDLNHMPAGCGTWPAVWMLGPNWPAGGEIDIVEGVNVNTNNQVTLHTSDGCAIDTSLQSQTGTTLTTSCVSPGTDNSGCGVSATTANTYGAGFNSAGGGVYAAEWTTSAIKVWFFQRGSVPSDIAAGGNVTPANWGTPMAHFPLGASCAASHFSNMQIVLDLTFCGDWAGKVYGTGCTGGSGDAACQYFVINYPQSFKEAYWSINSIKTFTAA
ncbi:concanavalin A-like lectin/glucanase domain-containing protein [Zopfochytrium polystomum]|nr:concanavalin A-like lectin/glucanase domain-containing protein [Zopfochytrium polystomum]